MIPFFCSVKPMSSRPLMRQCLRKGSTSKGTASPSSLKICCSGRSMVNFFFASASTINISTLSFVKVMGSMPFLKQLLKNMSAKLGAMMQRMPKSLMDHGACSREEPQPKFSMATRTWADLYGSWLRTKSGFSVTPSSSYRSSKKADLPSPVRWIVFKNCLGMMQSVSTFALRRGAATTPSSFVNFGMPPVVAPPSVPPAPSAVAAAGAGSASPLGGGSVSGIAQNSLALRGGSAALASAEGAASVRARTSFSLPVTAAAAAIAGLMR
mmetsp:Transcript_24428/g.67140  ORF Transcript_24428/g.67140 Transcript_24428/m.67140 type:complete len:268 (+) Transcript_24428:521-1324(+)